MTEKTAGDLYEQASVRCPNCGAGCKNETPRSMDQKAEHDFFCQCSVCNTLSRANTWIVWP